MNVLISALALRAGGGQTHLYNLLKELPRDESHTFYLLAPVSFKEPENLKRLIRLRPWGLSWIERPLFRFPWELLILPFLLRSLKIEALLIPGGILVGLKPRAYRVITICQNMMPFDHAQRSKYPWGYMRLRTVMLESAFLKSFARSDVVVFISRFARDKVLGLLGQNRPTTVIVAPPGISPEFIRRDDKPLSRPEWLPDDYVLYVSTIDVYKAQVDVVRGFAKYLRENSGASETLVLVGSEYRPYAKLVRDEVQKHGISGNVIIKGLVEFKDLPAIYQNAKVNVFASECENCPNILLEAMASGRPALVSNCPPMPEFGESFVHYFSPKNSDEFCEKLTEILRVNGSFDGKEMITKVESIDGAGSATLIWDAVLDVVVKKAAYD